MAESHSTPDASSTDATIAQIAGKLRGYIAAGKWRYGDKLPTIMDLSKGEGVTAYQAREAVLRLARQGLLVTRRGAGTFVASPSGAPDNQSINSRTRLREVVSLLVPAGDDQSDRLAAMFNGAFQGSDLTLTRPGWTPRAASPHLKAALAAWAANPPHAIIFGGVRHGLQREVHRACGERSIVIDVMCPLPEQTFMHCVTPDYRAVYRLAAEHLIAQGHRRIGIVTHHRNAPAGVAHDQIGRRFARNVRLRTFGRVVRNHVGRGGLTIHRQLGPGAPKVEPLVHWLSQPDRPTAVYASDHRIAQVIRAAERLGLRVPDDLEVLGEGNTMWAEEFEFPSIDLRLQQVASHVAAMLRREPSEYEFTRAEYLIQPRLIDRPSPSSG